MIYQQPAFVLHSRPYRETSVMLTFFTPEFGKLNATIRGVRSAGKRAAQKQAWLQPFQALQIQWRAAEHSHSEWINPQNFEPHGLAFALRGEASLCGLYLNELLYRLLQPCAPMVGLFVNYQQTLQALSQASDREHQAWCLRQFELGLLVDLGYELDLTQDHQGQPLVADARYGYNPQLGLIRLSHASQDEWSLNGDCLIKLAQQHFCSECLPTWKQLMRRVLQPHLGHKPLATRQLFKSY